MRIYKISQITIPCLSILILFILSTSCHQKTANERPNLPLNTEPIALSKLIDNTNKSAGNPAVIYQSNDMGRTWSSFAKGIPADATLSSIQQFGNKVYVATDYHGIFVATNRQNNWIPLKSKNLKGLDINCLEVYANKLIIGTLRHGILVSDDGGLNWKQSKQGINTSPIRAFIKSENKLYAGTDSGIFESFDTGNTWSHSFGQLQILGFTSLNDKIYAATQNGVLMKERGAKNWTAIYNGDALHDIGNDGKYIYAMTIGQQLLKTQNDGIVWENAQNGIIRPPNYYTNELQHIGNNIFSAQWIGIYHSSDNGNSWRMLDGLPDSTAFSTLAITDFGILAGISIR